MIANRVFLAALLMIPTGIHLGCGGSDNQVDRNQTSSSESEVGFTSVAEKLRLTQVRPGYWVVRDKFHRSRSQLAPTKFSSPIEVINDPVVANRIEKGLRPDGETMYRYPDKMPAGYPDEWLQFAINLFPKEVQSVDAISTGHLILHGHFINPPYKIQVVAVSNNDVRVFINGIDLKVPYQPTDKEKRMKRNSVSVKRDKDTKANKHLKQSPVHTYRRAKALRLATQSMADNLSPIIGHEATGVLLSDNLRNNPDISDVSLKGSASALVYKFVDPHTDVPLIATIVLNRPPEIEFSSVLEDRIEKAAGISRLLGRGGMEIIFTNMGMSSRVLKTYYKLRDLCSKSKQYTNDDIVIAKGILRHDEEVFRLLANCGR